jgi:alpha-tubulin suppressor-like RCC1 family protein
MPMLRDMRWWSAGWCGGMLLLAVGCGGEPVPPARPATTPDVVVPAASAAAREPRPGDAAARRLVAHDNRSCGAVLNGVACFGGFGVSLSRPKGAQVETTQRRGEIVSLARGPRKTCAVYAAGEAWCWGSAPKRFAVADVVEMAITADATCARTRNGRVYCARSQPLASGGEEQEPADVGVANAVQLAAGADGVCALVASGIPRCWATRRPMSAPSAPFVSRTPETVEGQGEAVEIVAGGHRFCVRAADGVVKCTPDRGADLDPRRLEMRAVERLEGAKQLAANDDHGCALLEDGTVACWGNNDHGQLGDGSRTSSPWRSVDVRGLEDAIEVAVGARHSCARRRDGSVWCWGSDGNGQLLGQRAFDARLRTVQRVPAAAQLVTVGATTCLRSPAGEIWCWGSAARVPVSPVGCRPRRLEVGGSALELAMGSDTYAVRQDGSVAKLTRTGPEPVTLPDQAVQVAAGSGYACARLARGQVACWGANDVGQLGRGPTPEWPKLHPAAIVDGLDRVDAVVARDNTVCALVAGAVHCWGVEGSRVVTDTGSYRRKGRVPLFSDRPKKAGRRASPSTAPGMLLGCHEAAGVLTCGTAGPFHGVRGVDVGSSLSCVRGERGPACWPHKLLVHESIPGFDETTAVVRPAWAEDAVEIAPGFEHVCVRDGAGKVACLGRNDRCQLAGTPPSSAVPLAILDGAR